MAEPRTETLPKASESEQALLGAMLMEPTAAALGLEMVKVHQLASNTHKTIYGAIQAIHRSGEVADIVTVAQWLKQRNQLDKEAGGIDYIFALPETCPSTTNIEGYAKPILDAAAARDIITVCEKLRAQAMSGEIPPAEIVQKAQQEIFGIGLKGTKSDALDLNVLLAKQYRALVNRMENPGSLPGQPTGFYEVDNMLGGMRAGEVIVVGGRPKMGKSAFADQIADHVASVQELPVVMFSYEMSGDQLVERRLASTARVNSQHFRRGTLDDAEQGQVADAFQQMFNRPRVYFENRDLTVFDMQARVQRVAAEKGGVALVVVDYIQLVKATNPGDSRPNQIFEVMRGLSSLASKMSCPVIALSQLVNEIDKREDKRPTPGDYRDGGAILSEAHTAILIYRAGYYQRERAREQGREDEADSIRDHEAEIIFAAQRNGPVGTVLLNWQSDHVRFENREEFPRYGSRYHG